MQDVVVPLITPFTLDGKIDFVVLESLLLFHLQKKTSQILVLGTTGEANLLSFEEKKAIIEISAHILDGKKPLIVGISSPSTNESVTLCKLAKEYGAQKVLCTLPYYVKTTKMGLFKHFEAVQNVGLDVILYENPSRIGASFSIGLLKELEQFEKIQGIKASTTNLEWIQSVQLQTRFMVYCGDDFLIPSFLKMGIVHTISATANLFPDEMFLLGEEELDMLMLLNVLYLEPNPIGLKYAMSLKNMCQNVLRLPLVCATEHTQSTIDIALDKLTLRATFYS
ncbi:MAG: 4-hydroxy-tetrahydrodipicolinate synthase [Chlamydiae bacterium]|nr:4-hydroxy-tetrahydrodipicolinate synthase [Chlamydiota bacterium]